MNQFLDLLIVSGGILGLFMSFSIARSSFYKSKANNYLSGSIVILTLIMILGWINADTGFFALFQSLMWEFLVPVTLFSYFLTHSQHPFLQSSWYKYLYLPFAVTLTVDLILEMSFSLQWYTLPLTEEHPWVDLFFTMEDAGSFFYNIGLMVLARILVKRTKLNANIKKWLLRLNLIILGILCLWFVQELEDAIFDSEEISQFVWIAIALLFWFVLYHGVFRLQIAIERKEISEVVNTQKETSPKSTQQSSQTYSQYIKELMVLLEEKHWYKKTLLSRLDLATELGISEGYLSQIINQELKKSVIQLINEYRIEEAKRLLQNAMFNKYSIEALGMESGFKSKSVFYSAFKTATGISPGAYRKQFKTS